MAKRRKPENETPDQADTRHVLETISNTASRSEKVSWDRKMDNMVTLMASLQPIEDKILDLIAAKTPIIDEITSLRKDMVKTCTHPYPQLTVKGNTVHCKFCNRTFAVLSNGRSE